MEQSTEIFTPSPAPAADNSLSKNFSEDEIFVALFLLDLCNLVSMSESSRPKSVWGKKRKRSCLDSDEPSSCTPSFSSPAAEPTANQEIQVKSLQPAAAPAAATASPDTPLSFPPSESDDKPRNSFKKPSKKMSKENYIEMIQELSSCRDSLKGEIAIVRKYHDRLKAHNSQLNAAKQKALKLGPIREEFKIESLANEPPQPIYYHTGATPLHPPSMDDQIAKMFQQPIGPIPTQFFSAPSNGLGPINNVGPSRVPDLNVSAVEVFKVPGPSQPLDVKQSLVDKRARCAEARRMRKGLIKIKAMRSACGIKLPRS